jgi:hypothetical protein
LTQGLVDWCWIELLVQLSQNWIATLIMLLFSGVVEKILNVPGLTQAKHTVWLLNLLAQSSSDRGFMSDRLILTMSEDVVKSNCFKAAQF